MKTAFLILEIVMILGQMFHSYWLLHYASNLPSSSKIRGFEFNPRVLQAVVMCGAFDASIVFAMKQGIYWWVGVGLVLLVVFNFFYIYNTTEDLKSNKKNEKAFAKRRQLVMYVVGVVNPAGVGIFAYLYVITP